MEPRLTLLSVASRRSCARSSTTRRRSCARGSAEPPSLKIACLLPDEDRSMLVRKLTDALRSPVFTRWGVSTPASVSHGLPAARCESRTSCAGRGGAGAADAHCWSTDRASRCPPRGMARSVRQHACVGFEQVTSFNPYWGNTWPHFPGPHGRLPRGAAAGCPPPGPRGGNVRLARPADRNQWSSCGSAPRAPHGPFPWIRRHRHVTAPRRC